MGSRGESVVSAAMRSKLQGSANPHRSLLGKGRDKGKEIQSTSSS